MYSKLSKEMLDRIAAGRANFEGEDLHSLDFHDLDLSNANLRETLLDYANLHGVCLSGADLADASVTDINLTEAWFDPDRPPTWTNREKLKRILITGEVKYHRWTLLETDSGIRFRFGCEEQSVDEWSKNHLLYAKRHTRLPEKWADITKTTLDMALRFTS